MELIDTHLHLIDRSVTGHAWTHRVPPLQRDFPLEEAQRLYGSRVRGSIFMEVAALDWQAESRWIASLVREGRLLGQIANCRPETDEGFEAWLEEGRELGVVGYRRILLEDVGRGRVAATTAFGPTWEARARRGFRSTSTAGGARCNWRASRAGLPGMPSCWTTAGRPTSRRRVGRLGRGLREVAGWPERAC
jgi:predicted TIM-barrel fold metal-dependent hydrolase